MLTDLLTWSTWKTPILIHRIVTYSNQKWYKSSSQNVINHLKMKLKVSCKFGFIEVFQITRKMFWLGVWWKMTDLKGKWEWDNYSCGDWSKGKKLIEQFPFPSIINDDAKISSSCRIFGELIIQKFPKNGNQESKHFGASFEVNLPSSTALQKFLHL